MVNANGKNGEIPPVLQILGTYKATTTATAATTLYSTLIYMIQKKNIT